MHVVNTRTSMRDLCLWQWPLDLWTIATFVSLLEGGTTTLFFCSLVSKYVICMYPYQVNNVAYRHNEVIIKFSLKLLLQHVQDTFIICRFSQHDKLMPRFISKEGLLQRCTEKKNPETLWLLWPSLAKIVWRADGRLDFYKQIKWAAGAA